MIVIFPMGKPSKNDGGIDDREHVLFICYHLIKSKRLSNFATKNKDITFFVVENELNAEVWHDLIRKKIGISHDWSSRNVDDMWFLR